MRIAVTGRDGQVARSLAERGPALGHELVPVGRPALDLAGDADLVVRALRAVAPDLIVSAAAYTAVDRAETEPDLALAINANGAGAVAEAAKALGVPLIHFSTDYVFDGARGVPYLESDSTGPLGIYGASKLAGEKAVLGVKPNSVILRTAWVYSPFGGNFVKTMLRLAAERDEISVVADQIGSPTSALDIADGVIRVGENLASGSDAAQQGILHMAARGEASWADFAEAIFHASAAAGGPIARVRRISTAQFPTPAKRPANSRLDSGKLERTHGVRLPAWQDSLPRVVERLVRT